MTVTYIYSDRGDRRSPFRRIACGWRICSLVPRPKGQVELLDPYTLDWDVVPEAVVKRSILPLKPVSKWQGAFRTVAPSVIMQRLEETSRLFAVRGVFPSRDRVQRHLSALAKEIQDD